MSSWARLLAIGSCPSCFVAAAVIGVLLAAGLVPFLAPRGGPTWRVVGRHILVLGLVWLALAAILDLNHVLYGPR
jgi:hypothetical protein